MLYPWLTVFPFTIQLSCPRCGCECEGREMSQSPTPEEQPVPSQRAVNGHLFNWKGLSTFPKTASVCSHLCASAYTNPSAWNSPSNTQALSSLIPIQSTRNMQCQKDIPDTPRRILISQHIILSSYIQKTYRKPQEEFV